MAICTGKKKNGEPCTRTADNTTGRCSHHEKDAEPQKQLPAVPAQRTELDDLSELKLPDLKKKVLQIKDLDSLRVVNLFVINALADGTIDPKAGSPITQLLKQQADLIKETVQKGKNTLDETGRKIALNIALSMDDTQAFALMANFTEGFAKLQQNAMKHSVAETIEVKPIETEKPGEPIQNTDSRPERPQGIRKPSSSPEEIF